MLLPHVVTGNAVILTPPSVLDGLATQKEVPWHETDSVSAARGSLFVQTDTTSGSGMLAGMETRVSWRFSNSLDELEC